MGDIAEDSPSTGPGEPPVSLSRTRKIPPVGKVMVVPKSKQVGSIKQSLSERELPITTYTRHHERPKWIKLGHVEIDNERIWQRSINYRYPTTHELLPCILSADYKCPSVSLPQLVCEKGTRSASRPPGEATVRCSSFASRQVYASRPKTAVAGVTNAGRSQ